MQDVEMIDRLPHKSSALKDTSFFLPRCGIAISFRDFVLVEFTIRSLLISAHARPIFHCVVQ